MVLRASCALNCETGDHWTSAALPAFNAAKVSWAFFSASLAASERRYAARTVSLTSANGAIFSSRTSFARITQTVSLLIAMTSELCFFFSTSSLNAALINVSGKPASFAPALVTHSSKFSTFKPELAAAFAKEDGSLKVSSPNFSLAALKAEAAFFSFKAASICALACSNVGSASTFKTLMMW